MENDPKKSGYSKRPVWQWIVIYLVIGAIVYGIIYYFLIAGKNKYGSGSSSPQNRQQNQPRDY